MDITVLSFFLLKLNVSFDHLTRNELLSGIKTRQVPGLVVSLLVMFLHEDF